MLSKGQMVRVKDAIEGLYDSTCDAIEYKPYTKPNGATSNREVTVLKEQPCRVSFKNISAANGNESATGVKQVVTLFISPDIQIKPNSKLLITKGNRTTAYANSGEPAIYDTHQEVVLELFERWA